jgi:hypothetical protein
MRYRPHGSGAGGIPANGLARPHVRVRFEIQKTNQ